VGTGNQIWRDAPRHPHGQLPPMAAPLAGTREWWAIAASAQLATAAGVRFRAEWQRASLPPPRWARAAAASVPPVGVPRPQVPPLRVNIEPGRLRLVTGGAAIAALLGSLITGAGRRALAVVPYVSADAPAAWALVRGLACARDRGVDARLLLGEQPAPGQRGMPATSGVDVRFMSPARSTVGHAKGLVADGVVVVSSANWSEPGLGTSFEAALAVDDAAAAAYYAAAWARDWSAALQL
jgi:phosphatidylserine/phosphatidylglycerophosphate/cardiolipin synthase-like enzyme